MRNKISGAIGVVWGSLILYNGLTSHAEGSAAYQSGHAVALVFGAMLLVAGLYYFFKKPKPKT
jgi:hypothetical protein